MVRAEIIVGHRSAKQRTAEVTFLDSLFQVPTPESIWDQLGINLAALRRGGITVPFPDTLLATIAIAHGLELWTRDKHFSLMQTVLTSLQLFAEPP